MNSEQHTMRELRQAANNDLRCAENHLDEAFSVLNHTAFGDGSTLTDDQIVLVQRAMDQISHAVLNVISAVD